MPRQRTNTSNSLLYDAVSTSKFRSLKRLAQHLGIPYNALNRYVRLERHPIDEEGFVKPDIAAVCDVLGSDLKALFPAQTLAGSAYRFREDLSPGEIQNNPGKMVTRRFAGSRILTAEQATSILPLIAVHGRVQEEGRHAFAEAVAQRLTDAEFALVEHRYFEGLPIENTAEVLGITTKAARALEQKALRALNSPKNLKLLQMLRA